MLLVPTTIAMVAALVFMVLGNHFGVAQHAADCNLELMKSILNRFPIGVRVGRGTQHLLYDTSVDEPRVLYRVSFFYQESDHPENSTFRNFDVDNFLALPQHFISSSCEHHLLLQIIDESLIKNTTTIAPYELKRQEREAVALAVATPNLQNVVSSPIQHSDVVIPNSRIRGKINDNEYEMKDITMVVEVVPRFDGAVGLISYTEKFSYPVYWRDVDALVLIAKAFIDQHSLSIAKRIIHMDCHSFNIFYQRSPHNNRTSFVIGDMGMSLSDKALSVEKCELMHKTSMYRVASTNLLEHVKDWMIPPDQPLLRNAVQKTFDYHNNLVDKNITSTEFFSAIRNEFIKIVYDVLRDSPLLDEFRLANACSVEWKVIFDELRESKSNYIRVNSELEEIQSELSEIKDMLNRMGLKVKGSDGNSPEL